jgi:hypothetical protein
MSCIGRTMRNAAQAVSVKRQGNQDVQPNVAATSRHGRFLEVRFERRLQGLAIGRRCCPGRELAHMLTKQLGRVVAFQSAPQEASSCYRRETRNLAVRLAEWVSDSQSSRINDLELVADTGIEPDFGCTTANCFVLEAPVGVGVERPRHGFLLHDELNSPTDGVSWRCSSVKDAHRVVELCPKLCPNP